LTQNSYLNKYYIVFLEHKMKYKDLNKPKKGYAGYLLPDVERDRLFSEFPPKYSKTVAHHVTTKFGATENETPDDVESYSVVGYADTGDGLEALVISIGGTVNRPDGSIYHITWSINPEKYKPKDSNDLVKRDYDEVGPINIDMVPTFFPFN